MVHFEISGGKIRVLRQSPVERRKLFLPLSDGHPRLNLLDNHPPNQKRAATFTLSSGPLCAEGIAILGQQSRGGLGKPLGGDEKCGLASLYGCAK